MDRKSGSVDELESGKASPHVLVEESRSSPSPLSRGWQLLSSGSELRGIAAIAEEDRIAPRYWSNFTLWFSMNATIACFATGTLAPLLFGLSFEASAYTIAGFNLFSCSIPSFIALFGPRLGLRTMTIARYSFGWWFAIVPAIFNLVSFIGFCAVNAIVGGQTLAAIEPGSISINVGIVIIALVSLGISWSGYRVLHAFERYSWMPVLVAFIVLLGVSGSKLSSAFAFESTPTTAANVLSFASIVVGFSLSWAGCSADFNTYLPSDISAAKLIGSTFVGLYIPSAGFQIIGAAFGAAALSNEIPSWSEAFANSSVGGLLGVALIEPLGGFGKFLLVVLALGIITNCAPTIYAFSLSAPLLLPIFSRIPRPIFALIATSIFLPVAIVGADQFPQALSNFLGLLGYWVAVFCPIFLIEHFVFRKASWSAYAIEDWNTPSRLPPGYAAAFSCAVGLGMIILAMDQVWYRGPIAIRIAGPDETHGGDIGFELAFSVVGVCFLGSRWVEKRVFRR